MLKRRNRSRCGACGSECHIITACPFPLPRAAARLAQVLLHMKESPETRNGWWVAQLEEVAAQIDLARRDIRRLVREAKEDPSRA